jgi:hypothetical protein
MDVRLCGSWGEVVDTGVGGTGQEVHVVFDSSVSHSDTA